MFFTVNTFVCYPQELQQPRVVVQVHRDADESKFPPQTDCNSSNFLCNLDIVWSQEENIRRLLKALEYCFSIFFVEFNNQRLGIYWYEILKGLSRYLAGS